MSDKQVLIFYDGECGFCQQWVQFLLNHNPGFFFFAPLQGRTARQSLGEDHPYLKDLSTLVVKDLQGQWLIRSQAAFYLFSYLKGPWKLLSFFRYITPRFVSDSIYKGVARLRLRLGAKNFCMAPTPEQKTYLLN